MKVGSGALGVDMSERELLILVGIVAVVLVGAGYAATKAVQAVAPELNPLNPENIFAGTVNQVGKQVTGETDWTLGGYIYDVTHPEDPDGNQAPDIFGKILDGILIP